MANEVIFEAHHMHKAFGPTIALKDVDFTLRRGEIRGLIGENGSGKSTIMSIAGGMQPATSGEMLYMGKPWQPRNMIESQQAGISMILQEANTINGVTVAQNLFAGREKEFSRFGVINMNKMYSAADKLLKKFGIENIRGRDSISSLTFEDCKLTEIVRCVSDDTQILVVDETTTALSMEGREILYRLIHKMAAENKAVVFISHDMDEILAQCTALTVLRDGDIIGSLTRGEMDAPDAVQRIRFMMVGREIGEKYYREDTEPSRLAEVALTLENISFGAIHDFSLELHKGEIVGFGGLSGCGMHEIGRAAYGLEKLDGGRVRRGEHTIRGCLDAIQHGIGYISKNRDTEALIMDAAIQGNIVLPSLSSLQKHGFISPAAEKKLAQKQIDALRIKCGSGAQFVSTLSGGNKQKVSFAKWLAKDSDILIMDCPTRGVDIGVKQAMYALIDEMKKSGKAILLISEELSELIGMADRIIIMKDFVVTKEFNRSADLKQTDIIEYMI
ncbi:MAG: sugar ABC transporter ATP-binding protein [Eubacteriales bacterium]|nr:sugar ABC transporter ATP-binding protein [Eubacteriales bacterium]MDD3882998.1 sugar ABC transporter ATP-binding protein [Eubacteriales bacterium]MDD4513454.1 sugar ABC transporter ATP-binding protein [Eubacteriales bacterium]